MGRPQGGLCQLELPEGGGGSSGPGRVWEGQARWVLTCIVRFLLLSSFIQAVNIVCAPTMCQVHNTRDTAMTEQRRPGSDGANTAGWDAVGETDDKQINTQDKRGCISS